MYINQHYELNVNQSFLRTSMHDKSWYLPDYISQALQGQNFPSSADENSQNVGLSYIMQISRTGSHSKNTRMILFGRG